MPSGSEQQLYAGEKDSCRHPALKSRHSTQKLKLIASWQKVEQNDAAGDSNAIAGDSNVLYERLLFINTKILTAAVPQA